MKRIMVLTLGMMLILTSVSSAPWRPIMYPSIDGYVKTIFVQGHYDIIRKPVLVVGILPDASIKISVTLDFNTFRAYDSFTRVKFDAHDIETYNVRYSPDRRTMIIAEDDVLRFTAKLKKASKLVMAFDVRGFDERRLR